MSLAPRLSAVICLLGFLVWFPLSPVGQEFEPAPIEQTSEPEPAAGDVKIPEEGSGAGSIGLSRPLDLNNKPEVNPASATSRLVLSGECRADDINRGLRKKYKAISNCYKKTLEVQPSLVSVRMVYTYVVNEKGRTEDLKLVSVDHEDPQLTTCVTKVISRVRYAAPEGGKCTIRLPLVFVAP